MGLAEEPRTLGCRADVLAWCHAADEKGAADAFYEDNECGAEMIFTDVGLDVLLNAVDGAGHLLPLWTHKLMYPFTESELLDEVDRLDRMFDHAADVRGLDRDELHTLTEAAKAAERTTA